MITKIRTVCIFAVIAGSEGNHILLTRTAGTERV